MVGMLLGALGLTLQHDGSTPRAGLNTSLSPKTELDLLGPHLDEKLT